MRLDAAIAELGPDHASGVTGDLSKGADVDALRAALPDTFDLLVNAAGVFKPLGGAFVTARICEITR